MTQQEMLRVKRAVIRKYPIFASVALLNVPIEEDNKIATAGVYATKNDKGEHVLKGIKYNSDFFDSLSFEQQVFVLAHEACHIAFKHFARSLDKPEKDIERKYQEYCSNVSDENLRKLKLIKLRKKYYNYWNIATDACINAFLKKDGLEAPEGAIDKRTGKPMKFVNIADGLYRRSELIYDSIVKKEEDKEKIKNNQQNGSQKNQNNDNSKDSSNDFDNNQNDKNSKDSGNDFDNDDKNSKDSDNDFDNNQIGGGLDDIDIDNYQGIDSHDEWVSEPEEKEDKVICQEKESKNKKSIFDKIKEFFGFDSKNEDKTQKNSDENNNEKNKFDISDDETTSFFENEKYLNQNKTNSVSQSLKSITEKVGCDNIKSVKPVLSWKQLLVRYTEEDTQKWGYRRANNNMPNARIEDRTLDDKATTEIILDTSGSIPEELLKAFLMQLVPLFKESKIKVGCFSGTFYGFTELRTIKEIEQFKAIRDKNGTNYEAAVTAFSKNMGNERVNKLIFTDGKLDDCSDHKQRTRVEDIIWVVFGNEMNFNPLGGRIIRVSQNDLNEIISNNQITYNLFTHDDSFESDVKRRGR